MIIYTPPAPASSIPLIDLGDGGHSDPARRAAVAWEIHKACRDIGFFYIANHGVPEALMHDQLEQVRRLFALASEQKAQVGIGNSFCRRGYEPPQQQTLDQGSPPDLKESFMLGRELPPEHPYVARRVPMHGPNQWPAQLPGFRPQMEAYTGHMIALGQRLLSCLALSLELEEDYFSDGLAEPQCGLRLLHYPPQPPQASFNQMGAGAHTDWGTLTILLQDQRGGLEVRNAAGQWLRADPIPGTFVVNLGQLTARLTNGLYCATMHRVMNNLSGQDRYSVTTFFDFDYFYQVACAPSCAPAEGEPLYPPATVGQHIEEMSRRSYG